jgi:hypothetical protein
VTNFSNSPFFRKNVFVHHGHIGDIIAFLPVFQVMQGTHLIIADSPYIQPPMSGFKYDSLKPLLESQKIVVTFGASEWPIDHDTTGWRDCYRDDISLTDAQARYMNVVSRINGKLILNRPWIEVDADPSTKGRVIFNRTPRYRNHSFPWKQVLHHFGNRALFIGTTKEHQEFINEVGEIEHYPTQNCLDVAKAIEGSDFFVGNQSSSFWIAAGLKKPLLQEVFNPAPNSIIPYEGAWYCRDGNIDFNQLEK